MGRVMNMFPNIVPPATEHTSTINTGAWKYMKPVRALRMSPCSGACPIKNNIQAVMSEIENGSYQRAWSIFHETNPFPAIMGRICQATCESACTRSDIDESLSIRAIERAGGDYGLSERKMNTKMLMIAQQIGKHVEVV